MDLPLPDAVSLRRWLDALEPVVVRAGRAILAVRDAGAAVQSKADGSPVTAADRAAEAIVVEALAALDPRRAVLAEEAAAAGRIPDAGASAAGSFWAVDPLDGTREFVDGRDEFTVNVALVERGRPVLGLVHAPALDAAGGGTTWLGAVGLGAWKVERGARRPIACRAAPPGGALVVLASRSHGDRAALARLLEGVAVERVVEAGSSVKLAWLAEGRGDVYPRAGPTMAWDIAAGHAVLAASGGGVIALPGGAPLGYALDAPGNPDFVAFGRGGDGAPGQAVARIVANARAVAGAPVAGGSVDAAG